MSQDSPARTAGSRWARWRKLPPRERRETLLAAGLIPFAAASVRIVGVDRTLNTLAGRPESAAAVVDPSVAREAARAVARAAHNAPYRGNCLSRSIALMWLLRRRGLAADLRFGARMRERNLEAHSWVEHGGIVLNDTQNVTQRFSPFVTPAGPWDEAADQPTTIPSNVDDRPHACVHEEAIQPPGAAIERSI
jgi:hypothetical protein